MLVNVTEGTLKGEKVKNVLNSEEFYSFKGIPFAKPPVGKLRFKAPVPPEKYPSILDATVERPMCPQKTFYDSSIRGDEDCLYLNVYTPKLPSEGDALKPVMFYLYGGGCTEGQKDSFLYGPDFLVTKDVVLVVPNYRVNIIGFLNLGLDVCPGNAGLKDQVAALKWTKQNISQFGGDPNNITIFGESAGAASTLYHLFSPLAKGLFHKAIVQSGNISHSRSFVSTDVCIDRASRVAKKLGFVSKNPLELHDFLLKVPAHNLTATALGILTQEERDKGELFPFTPSLEIVGPVNERAINAKGSELMKQDPGVPIMDGICSHEALFSMRIHIVGKRPIDELMRKVEALCPRIFREFIKSEETEQRIVKDMKQFYFGEKSSEEDLILSAVDIFSDIMYNRGYHESINAFLRNSSQPVYSYVFSYHGTLGLLDYLFNYKRPAFLKGAGHTDELGYLFNMEFNKENLAREETDRKIIEHMTTIWTNFAKYSNPGKGLAVDFKPISSAEVSYLDINEELTVKSGFAYEKRMKFLDSVFASVQNVDI